ncbi:hypothetical protein [Mycolicibacterium porcinum]|uniref:Uncharacterized protein n=1 Tax=Mycolicibacterium porcinum TaxID=39693 RepID=A0ABV3VIC3_9MYCO
MTSVLTDAPSIRDALRQRMRVGEGLSVPYARKWSIGGCDPRHSLWSYPHDAILDFSTRLSLMGVTVLADDNSIIVDMASASVWAAVNGNSRSADRASAFLIGCITERVPAVIVNSSEVAAEVIRALPIPPAPRPSEEIIQIGFPGVDVEDRVYVGSWQWDIHAEVRNDEFVSRTANAALAAIRAKEAGYGS